MEQMRNKTGILALILRLLLAYLGSYGILYVLSLAGMDQAFFSTGALLLMIENYLLLEWTRQRLIQLEKGHPRKRRILWAATLGFLFALTMIMGYQLQQNGLTECGFRGKGLILLRSLCLMIALFPFANLLLEGTERLAQSKPPVSTTKKEWSSKGILLFGTFIVFLCLIPVWLAYYPITMSYDFHRQVNEAYKEFIWFFPYQPLAHTWVIWVFLQLGIRLGDLETGMACMALFQMACYALVTSYSATFLYRLVKRKWAVVAALVFFALFPLNTVLVVCTTKDVLFSILFLLFLLLLAERMYFSSGRKQWVMNGLLLIEGCIMMQFRNNAFYAILVFVVFWVLFSPKKERLQILLLSVLLVVGGQGTAVAIKSALGTQIPPLKKEMYSVPIQQFARVGYYHAEEMDEATADLIASYIPQDLWNVYNAPIADTVKAHVDSSVFGDTLSEKLTFFKEWGAIGLLYPNEYLDAFLELTRGYWFMDDRSYAECLGYGVEERMGTIHTHIASEIDGYADIKHESKFPWLEAQLEQIVSGNSYYNLPVFSILFKSAFYFWSLMLCFAGSIYLKRRKATLYLLLPVLYMGTMLLGPVVQIRYLYPVMLSLPFLIGILFYQPELVSSDKESA